MEECTFASKMDLRRERHNEAALAPITEAIRHGEYSDCYIHMDGRDPWNPHDADGSRRQTLMAWLKGDYCQTSFPDIVVVVGRDADGNQLSCRGGEAIYIVEIKYTQDRNVHAVTQGPAMRQHVSLSHHLQRKWPGWKVQILPMVFGSFGTVRTETEHHLRTLGVGDHALKDLLRSVNKGTIKYTKRILQAHKEPNRFATVTHTRKRKALRTPKGTGKKRMRQGHHRQRVTDLPTGQAADQTQQRAPLHQMETRSRKRAAQDADTHRTTTATSQRDY
jgi:hypothetical protein